MNQWCKTQVYLVLALLVWLMVVNPSWRGQRVVYYIYTIKVCNIQLVTVLGPTFNPSQTH